MLLPSGSKINAMRQTGVDNGSMRNFTSCFFKCAMATSKSVHPPVIRVSAPDRDGAAAYRRVRERVLALFD